MESSFEVMDKMLKNLNLAASARYRFGLLQSLQRRLAVAWHRYSQGGVPGG